MIGEKNVYTVQLTAGGEALCTKAISPSNFFRLFVIYTAEDYGYIYKDLLTGQTILPDTYLNETVGGPGVYPNPHAAGHITYVRGTERLLSDDELRAHVTALRANNGEKADEYRLRINQIAIDAIKKKKEDKVKKDELNAQVNDLSSRFR